jgi:hypothetical protein
VESNLQPISLCGVLLEKLILAKLVKKFLVSYGIS